MIKYIELISFGELMEHLLLIFLTTITIATLMNLILRKFELPTILGYIFAGVAIRYLFHIDEEAKEYLEQIAEFGIVFLMFTIGLEFSISHLKSMKKEVFVFGSLEVLLLGTIFGAIFYYLFSFEIKSAIIVGFALALSSTAIVLKMLNDTSQIHSGFGRKSVGILIFQDLAVIPILLMISIFANSDQSLSYLLIKTIVFAVVLFSIIFIIGKYFIEKFLEIIISANSEEIFLVTILLLVVGSSFIADLLGFSFSLGAFLAGMTIAETKFRYRVESDLIPFRDILLGVFFISVGIQIDLFSAYENIGYIILVVVMAMAIKAVVIFGIVRVFSQSRTALKTALALFQIGEFSLAILALARVNNLLDPRWEQILIMSVVISMIITPFVLKNLKSIADRLFVEPEFIGDVIKSSGYKDHLIICGYGDLGKSLAQKFKKMGLFYLIIEHDNTLVEEAKADGHPVILANATQKSVLEAVNIKDSLAIMVAISNAKKLRLICENIASFDEDINSIVMVKNESHQKIIEDLKINHIVNQSVVMANALMNEAVKCTIR